MMIEPMRLYRLDTRSNVEFGRRRSLANFAATTTQWNQFAEQGTIDDRLVAILVASGKSAGAKTQSLQLPLHWNTSPLNPASDRAPP
jgi:hypothetical protein